MKKTLIALIAVSMLAACSTTSNTSDQETADQAAAEQQQTEEAPAEDEAGDAPAETQEEDVAELIESAATGDHRSDENIARNEYRNPVETLMFFGIEPDMTVVELWSGGGWYTEVLAPTLVDGKLVAANFAAKEDPEHYRTRLRKKLEARIQNEDVFSNVVHGTLQPGQKVDVGEPGSADMVVTFRNIHSFIGADIQDEVFAESYKVLKPGGILGVVQHRAPEGADPMESAEKGYVPEAYVIEMAEEAGFELVEKSEINANPKDTKDYPEGVWTLPPSLRLEDKDREKYEAIGESDRMTLKFVKPAEGK
ncbi:MAG: class I SAM-dependent methyltransferase [Myxococcota bacterium]